MCFQPQQQTFSHWDPQVHFTLFLNNKPARNETVGCVACCKEAWGTGGPPDVTHHLLLAPASMTSRHG